MPGLRSRLLSLLNRRQFRTDRFDWGYIRFYFGQFGEDAVLQNLIDPPPGFEGFYVDVGANHPLYLSNTHAFYRAGWRGINIEPNPEAIELFRRHRPRDINLNLLIGPAGEAEYYSFAASTYNTCDAALARSYQEQGIALRERRRLEMVPLAEVFARHLPPGVPGIDLLTVDCEGMDLEIVKTIDWAAQSPKWIVIEDRDLAPETEIVRYLRGCGYELAAWVSLSKIFRLRPATAGGVAT